jgi:hypothetical protein
MCETTPANDGGRWNHRPRIAHHHDSPTDPRKVDDDVPAGGVTDAPWRNGNVCVCVCVCVRVFGEKERERRRGRERETDGNAGHWAPMIFISDPAWTGRFGWTWLLAGFIWGWESEGWDTGRTGWGVRPRRRLRTHIVVVVVVGSRFGLGWRAVGSWASEELCVHRQPGLGRCRAC